MGQPASSHSKRSLLADRRSRLCRLFNNYCSVPPFWRPPAEHLGRFFARSWWRSPDSLRHVGGFVFCRSRSVPCRLCPDGGWAGARCSHSIQPCWQLPGRQRRKSQCYCSHTILQRPVVLPSLTGLCRSQRRPFRCPADRSCSMRHSLLRNLYSQKKCKMTSQRGNASLTNLLVLSSSSR